MRIEFDGESIRIIARKLADALQRRGVADKVLQEAMAEIAHDL